MSIPVPQALHLASQLLQRGQLREAETVCRQILAADPRQPGALHLLGLIAHRQGNHAAAVDFLQRALRIKPAADIHAHLGLVHQSRHDPAAAAAAFRHALALQPDNARYAGWLGMTLLQCGQREEGVALLVTALAALPEQVEFNAALGQAWQAQEKYPEAAACYRRVLQARPEASDIQNNLGVVLTMLGQTTEAQRCFRTAVAQGLPDLQAHSNLLLALSADDSCTLAAYLAEARRYGERASARARPFNSWAVDRGERAPRPLRVGVLSGDLRSHPVGYFFESMLEHSDPARVQWHAWVTKDRADALTERIRPRFAGWRSIAGLGDEAAAKLIHDDAPHILLDLAGHTSNTRLPVFAWRPAPVQAAWLGYFASTGVKEMDYLVADRLSVPENERSNYSERICYLPDTRLCFTAPAAEEAGDVAELPALARGHVTFGCFQNLNKVNDRVLALWARVLAAVPGSRLRVQSRGAATEEARAPLLARFAAAGIGADRVLIAEPGSRPAYFAAHAEVDMILDTFPYPGGTTTCEALWMGVPTLTLPGHTLLSRQGAQLMTAAGLPDWIARDEADFVPRAAAICADLPQLALLRAGLRAQVARSPLMDAPRFAAALTDALERMWRGED